MGEYAGSHRSATEGVERLRQFIKGREAGEGTRTDETLGPLVSHIGRSSTMVAGRLSVDCEVIFEGAIPRRVILYPRSRCDVLISGDYLRHGTVADTLGNVVIEGPSWPDSEPPESARGMGDGVVERVGNPSAAIVPRDWPGYGDPNIRDLQWDSTGMDGGHYGFDAGQGSGEDSRGKDV